MTHPVTTLYVPDEEGARWQRLFHLDRESRVAGREPLSAPVYMQVQVAALVAITENIEAFHASAVAKVQGLFGGPDEQLSATGEELQRWKKRLNVYRGLADLAFDPFDARALEWSVVGPLYFGVYDGPPVRSEGLHDVTTPYRLANMIAASLDHEAAVGMREFAEDVIESSREAVVASVKFVVQTSPLLLLLDGLGDVVDDGDDGGSVTTGLAALAVGVGVIAAGYAAWTIKRAIR